MRPERLALYTTMYPGVEPFLPAWQASVATQTDTRFDLCVGLDALTPDAVAEAAGGTLDARWVRGNEGDTPASIRTAALALLAERYDAVVLVDSDDVLHPTRVAAARAALQTADVAACALSIGDADATDLGLRFGPPDGDARGILSRYNVFGLSNSAYRADVLRACLPVQRDCVLFDWLLATRAWAAGATMSFDRVPRMTYRQHGANIAGVMPPYSAAYVLRACALVLDHYECALHPGWPMPSACRTELEGARHTVRRFAASITASSERLNRYLTALNALDPVFVWWWPIAHPALEELWSN